MSKIVKPDKTMMNKEENPIKDRHNSFLLFTSLILILSMLVGCGPSTEELEAVDYTPLSGDDWDVSTPAEQWWSANAGEYPVNFAWGHGGQLIVLVDELDLVIVLTADPF